MAHDVQIRWTRAGPTLERWFVAVSLPTVTESFAQIERIDGRWWLILFTPSARRRHPELREQRIAYRSPRLAKKHLEAWVRANWPAIERRFGIYRPPLNRGHRER